MRSGSTSVVVLAVVLGAAMWGGRLAAPLAPVNAAAQASSESSAARDSYQRSIDHFLFRATATDGPQRGEELYFYKCWFCHSALAERAPVLEDLFDRPSVSEQSVAEKIRQGGPGMPAYRHTLNDADVADLMSYLSSEKCCWEGEEPPPQPRYRAGSQPPSPASASQGGAVLRGGARGAVSVTGGGLPWCTTRDLGQ